MLSFVRLWGQIIRPKTLILALNTSLLGNILALKLGFFSPAILALTFLTTACLQILANLANDYGDYLKGSDTEDRLGPKRALQNSALSPETLKYALWIAGAASCVSGLCLLLIACTTIWDFLLFCLLGLAALACAILYTIGKKPYGYCGFGDLSVFIFFGLLGVLGCFYLQSHSLSWSLCLPAIANGFLSTLVLNMNNLRDFPQDKNHGKRTLVVLLGRSKATTYHLGLIFFSFLSLAIFLCYHPSLSFGWAFLLPAPFAFYHGCCLLQATEDRDYISLFPQSILLATLPIFFFSIGLCFS